MRRFRGFLAQISLAAALCVAAHVPAFAEWTPTGPIKMMIAFKAGGGSDTQGRMIAEGIENNLGWKIIPENVAGKGGANLAMALKEQPADGLAIGIAVTSTFGYTMMTGGKNAYSQDDFTFLITTAPTQMGIAATTDKGWTSLDDLVAAAKESAISIATLSALHDDAVYILSNKYDVEFNAVRVKGGKGSMNAMVAGDVDAGFVAGIQTKAVKAGDMVNLVSGESDRLTASPEVKTLKEHGIDLDLGVEFLFVAPAGLSQEARDAIANAIKQVMEDPESKASQFVNKAFGQPPLRTGEALDEYMKTVLAGHESVLKAVE